MKTSLLYLLSAVVLGIIITIAPLVAITLMESGNNKPNESYMQSLGQGLRQLEEGNGSGTSNANSSAVIILAISFIIALIAYGLAKERAPKRFHTRLGVPPY